jgi:DNA modification methylase
LRDALRGGAVLDPFMGSGTTAIVAKCLDRDFVGIELNPEYIKIAEKRLTERLGLFL